MGTAVNKLLLAKMKLPVKWQCLRGRYACVLGPLPQILEGPYT